MTHHESVQSLELNTKEREAPAVFFGLTLGQSALLLGWPLLVASLLFAFVLKPRIEAIEEGVRSRPGIKTVNVGSRMRALVDTGLSSEGAIKKASSEFEAYAAAGYVVIDNNAILAAPEKVKLK